MHVLNYMVLIALITVAPSTGQNTTGLQKRKKVYKVESLSGVDLVLLLDDSGSVAPYFYQEINFLHELVSRLRNYNNQQRKLLDPSDGMRIGIVKFSGSASTILELTHLSQEKKITDTINAIRHRGGSTDIGFGILESNKVLGKSNDERQKVIVAITDGHTGGEQEWWTLATPGTLLFGIGVGISPDYAAIMKAHTNEFIYVADYGKLPDMIKKLVNKLSISLHLCVSEWHQNSLCQYDPDNDKCVQEWIKVIKQKADKRLTAESKTCVQSTQSRDCVCPTTKSTTEAETRFEL